MKKLSLIFLAIFAISTSFAQLNKFGNYPFNINSRSISKNNFSSKFVPTDYKEILWSSQSNQWDPSIAYGYHLNYSDNKIITKYDLDYTGKDTSFKNEYIYDNQNHLIQINKFNYNKTDSTYILLQKELYYYYNNNRKSITVYQEFDFNTQTWLTKQRKIEEVDYIGNLILSRLEEFSSNSWKVLNYYGKGYTYYNNSKRLVLEIDSVYNNTTKRTTANNKTERIYNSLNQLEEFRMYSRNNNTFQLSTIIKIQYNSQGIPIREHVYDANSFPTLYPIYKTDSITWLSFNNAIEYFDNVQLTSVDSSYQDSIYSYYGKTIGLKIDSNNSYSVSYYTVVNDTLEKFSRIDNIFDYNKNNIEYKYYTANANNDWEISFGNRYIYTYDSNNNISELIEQNYNQNKFENYRKKEYDNYVLIDLSSNVKTKKNTLISTLYPNPSSNGKVYINVNMNTQSELIINVIDIKGNIVYTQNTKLNKGLNTIEISNLNQGLYSVVLTSENTVATSKLIIE